MSFVLAEVGERVKRAEGSTAHGVTPGTSPRASRAPWCRRFPAQNTSTVNPVPVLTLWAIFESDLSGR